jgi:hypothetical protein
MEDGCSVSPPRTWRMSRFRKLIDGNGFTPVSAAGHFGAIHLTDGANGC